MCDENANMKGTLLFGCARRKITPTVPVSLAGYLNPRMWDGVLDDIYVQALVLKRGGNMTAIVQFDLIAMPAEFVNGLRESLSDVPGLKPQNVVCAATHTHTAPEIRAKGESRSSPEYNAFALKQASAAVHEAARELRSGLLVCGRTSDDRFAFNRRYWMKSGKVVTNPPRRHPDIDRPEGPIDPEIGLLGVAVDGVLHVLVANIVNHCDTTGGSKVSGDWPGFFRRRLEKRLGPDAMVMPLIGTAGNINHFDVRSLRDQTNYHEARRIGEGYAETVEAAFAELTPSQRQEIRVRSATFRTGPREISEEELARAREDAQKYQFVADHDITSEDLAQGTPTALKFFADELLQVAEDREEREYEVMAMALGDAVLVSLPGEPFVEIGLRIKRELSPRTPTLVVSNANGSAGYIPNRFNFGRGGYETQPRSSPNSVATADILLDTVKSLLAGLTGG